MTFGLAMGAQVLTRLLDQMFQDLKFDFVYHYLEDVVIYRVSQQECAILQESVPYVKLYRYNPKHLYPKLNGYGDNGQISLKL